MLYLILGLIVLLILVPEIQNLAAFVIIIVIVAFIINYIKKPKTTHHASKRPGVIKVELEKRSSFPALVNDVESAINNNIQSNEAINYILISGNGLTVGLTNKRELIYDFYKHNFYVTNESLLKLANNLKKDYRLKQIETEYIPQGYDLPDIINYRVVSVNYISERAIKEQIDEQNRPRIVW